jgi:hypothetical protein
VDYDKAADFGAIKTFSLKIGTSWGNPLSEKRVSDEVTQTLTEAALIVRVVELERSPSGQGASGNRAL